jgi:integrase
MRPAAYLCTSHGFRLKRTSREDDEGRKAFSTDQLQLMFAHLTDPHSPLVNKDIHKWPALIAMFTGMRLNEIAQLEIQDVELRDEVWCINVTPEGEDRKRLKNAASKRRVLCMTGSSRQASLTSTGLRVPVGKRACSPPCPFHRRTATAEMLGDGSMTVFLKELDLGGQGLVFHCLRHTMVTRLAQAGVEEPRVKALLGHSQTGVTFSTYFKEGFLPAQLADAINRFDF